MRPALYDPPASPSAIGELRVTALPPMVLAVCWAPAAMAWPFDR